MTNKFKQIVSSGMLMLSLSQLTADPKNVRKDRSDTAADDMKASIKSQGLLQPLSVIENPEVKNGYIVKIGNRRLTALLALADEGIIDPKAKDIRCQPLDGTEQEILEAQISENVVRKAMNPVDELEAFAKLRDEGLTPEDISARFGTSVRAIQKRLALGSCAQVIRDALRAEEITIDAATAYAGCPDLDRQVRVFNSYKERGYTRAGYHEIRRALREERISTDDSLGKFIDQDEYVSRGGEIETDLIDQTATFKDSNLIYVLRDEKLKAEMERLSAEGWSFVEVHEDLQINYSTHTTEQGQLPALNEIEQKLFDKSTEELEALENKYLESDQDWTDEDIAISDKLEETIRELDNRENPFTDEQKKACGIFVTVGRDGDFAYKGGIKLREDEKSTTKSSTTAGNDNPEPKKRFSMAHADDIATIRGHATRAALIQHPDVAEDYMIFSILFMSYSGSYGMDNSIYGGGFNATNVIDVDPTQASTKIMAKSRSSVKSDIFNRDDPYGSWLRFLKLTAKQRSALIADAFTATLNSTGSQDDLTSQIVADLDVSLRDYWTPTAETYFGRLRSERIFEDVVELVGSETAMTVTKSNGLKKSELANLAQDIVAGKYPVEDDRKDSVKAWVPEDLEFTKNPSSRPSKARKIKAA